ncbi:MAG: hypothetical protein PHD43_15455 [Methylococcales bacterium]|nr:hypothetical protein [Methylococcales bacterium]
MAQAVASGQQVVWATGTHTGTPVYVFVNGPEQTMRPFAKILHHRQVGQLAIEAID